MPPRNVGTDDTSLLNGEDSFSNLEPVATPETHEAKRPPMRIVWRNVFLMAYLHIAALYGIYCMFYCKAATLGWTFLTYLMGAVGITAGAHRLWAHRTYTAKLPLRIFLALCNSLAFQNDIIEWSRDHRVHHKYSETEADPHNAKRGFFFSHIGWLMVRKHPDVKEKGKTIDISDLFRDPVCVFQRKIYVPSVVLMCFVVPAFVPWYFWQENFVNAFFVCSLLRYCLTLNGTWLVNSAAHMWGKHPYDQTINPSENLLVACGAVGEGFHNYHHTFPSDYSASEFGWKINITTMFIDFMALIGQATDRKRPSEDIIKKRRQRTGDGTHTFGIVGESYKDKSN